MNPLILVLIMAAIGGAVGLGISIRNKNRDSDPDNQKKDAEKRSEFEAMMEEGETFLASCTADRKRFCAVSSKRFLIETKDGLKSIPLGEIKKVTGKDYGANKTKDPKNMLLIEIKADKKYTVSNCSAEFEDVARELIALCPN